MRNVLMGTAALGLIVAAPAAAQNHGKGQDKGKAHGQAEKGERGPGKSRGPDKARGADKTRGPDQARGADQARGPDKAPGRQEARRDSHPQQARNQPPGQARRGPDHAARGNGNDRDLAKIVRQRDYARVSTIVERRDRPDIRRIAWRIVEPARVVHIDRPRTVFVEGCPPGRAKKHNGCLPPGQAKKLFERRAFYEGWWPYDRGDYRYRMDNGYLYRIRPGTFDILSYVPLLGGALSVGNVWPTGYAAAPVPDYYLDYYGYDDPYNYRYANGAIFGVDPQTNRIRQVAALLTGDDWAIGRRMPPGYDVYNVPWNYRNQYYDTPDAWYRYSDGYVYQVDPTTRLIQAAIQLIV